VVAPGRTVDGAIVGAGIDLVAHDDVREALRVHPERWAQRICTDAELDQCRVGPRLSVARLAERFAAKEAALKVLLADDDAIPWRAIQVYRDPGSRSVRLELRDAAARAAARRGIRGLRLDVSSAAGHAAAVVIATSAAPAEHRPPATPGRQPCP
jgi:holo-[acyl-carrier protein] synthase